KPFVPVGWGPRWGSAEDVSHVTIQRNSHMTNGRVEVITSVERRRRWRAAEKQQLVAASLEPGASVSAIAREAGIHPSQLYGWRRQLRTQQGIGFSPVRIAAEVAAADLAGGRAMQSRFT